MTLKPANFIKLGTDHDAMGSNDQRSLPCAAAFCRYDSIARLILMTFPWVLPSRSDLLAGTFWHMHRSSYSKAKKDNTITV